VKVRNATRDVVCCRRSVTLSAPISSQSCFKPFLFFIIPHLLTTCYIYHFLTKCIKLEGPAARKRGEHGKVDVPVSLRQPAHVILLSFVRFSLHFSSYSLERSESASHRERTETASHHERTESALHRERTESASHRERTESASHHERTESASHHERTESALHYERTESPSLVGMSLVYGLCWQAFRGTVSYTRM
jgi:hypothetical protein